VSQTEADIKQITSTDNSLVKEIVRLQLKKRARDESGLFVIEGYRENSRALNNGIKIKNLVFCRDWFLKDNNEELISAMLAAGVELVAVSKPVFKKLSYRDRPDGFISIATQPVVGLENINVEPGSIVLVVESVEKPGNLGTILRGCDATGLAGIVLCDPVTDVFNPNVVRASTGALFSVPLAVCSSAEEVIAWCKTKGIAIFSTTPHTEQIYWDVDFGIKQPIAIVAGAEQYGLSEVWFKESDQLVKLPMLGSADSLNIAVSSIVCLYEALRQRR
jgi:TrmH family RNA methyltransferase